MLDQTIIDAFKLAFACGACALAAIFLLRQFQAWLDEREEYWREQRRNRRP